MDDLTYTDARWRDAGVVVAYELAMEHGPATRNSFALACPLSSRPAIEPRSLVYMEGTEFGGIVDEIGVEAKRPRRKRAVYRGRTWHGLLAGKIVCPDAGRTHYRIRGEANAALLALVHRVGLGDLFTASSANSGITLDHQVRFADAYTAALGALRASGAKLAVSWDGDRAVLSAAPAKDWSAADELDTDRLGFDMAKCYRPVNHLVCVGEGELTDRAEVHFFADAEGNVVEVASETQPERGSDVYLCVKAPVQYVCDRALAELIAPKDGVIGTGKGCAGAVVVMDVRDGGIVALSSYPTFSPETFTGAISQDTWDLFNTDESYHPMLNRAVSGTYPAASTYKAFTGLAALAYGFADTKRTWDCGGSWDGFDTGQPQMCWKHSGHGVLDFRGGVVNSCDVVFYDIGKQFFQAGRSQGGSISDTAMQDEIAKYGFGKKTGIDLGSIEEVGRIPTPEWRAEHFRDYPTEAVWKGGFNTNMAIGQGDVLVTPIQVAVAYGAIATGNLMKPHLLKEVRNSSGGVVRSFEPEVVGTPDVKPENLAVMRDALKGVSTDNAELVALFNKFGLDPATVACKTGTGEVAGKEDYAWFACYAPFDDLKYVVACVVEQGGGGSDTAAPVVAEVMGALMDCAAGTSSVKPERISGSPGESVAIANDSGGRED